MPIKIDFFIIIKLDDELCFITILNDKYKKNIKKEN